jgi:serine/threonine-protein kinase
LTLQTRNGGLNERFINEARIQARLHHPGIATLYDYSEISGHPCIVMEYVGGQTLDEHIRSSGGLPLAQALRIFQAVAEAVSYIHQHSIVHRDIKSNNIKIGPDGEVKLLDFGIAKSESSPNLTSKGDVIGTFKYMSPEQLKGGMADARSDIWALGILFYEMIFGDVPFQAETIETLFGQIRNGAYLRPSALDPSLPREVEAIIARCLRKQPAHRYQSVEELLEEIRRLRAIATEEPAESAPIFFSQVRKHAKLLTALSALVLMMIAILYVATGGEPIQPVIQKTVLQSTISEEMSVAKGDVRSVKVQALEGVAEVYQNNERVGVTPYELKEQLGKRVELVLKRQGYVDKRVEFFVTENKREYTIAMNPAIQPQ